MRATFVLTTIVLALGLGTAAAASESHLFLRAAIVGLIPAIWVVSRLLEWRRGRDVWHFSPPYPYRWMTEAGGTSRPQPTSAERTGERPAD